MSAAGTGNPLRPSGVSPLFDGRTPVYVEVGADPSVAPGLQLPPGSVARFGAVYYFKNDTTATAWILVSIIGGAPPFSGLPGVSAPLTGDGTLGTPLAIPAATASNDGYMTAAQAAIIAQGGIGWRNRTLARVASKLGIGDESISLLTVEGGSGSSAGVANPEVDWLGLVVTGGGIGPLTVGRGGVTTISRATTTGSIHYQRPAGPMFEGASLSGRKWYMRHRIKFTGMSGFNAAAIYAFGASNSGAHASFIDVGVVAANSTTKYSARITGTTTVNLISTVNFDSTTYRWVECWCDGTNTFLSVEDETPISGAYVAFAAALKANLAYIVDGTSGTRDLNIDRAMWAVENPA